MKYSHLKRGERRRIFEAKCNRKSIGSIAKEVGRDKSTISRELRRNSDSNGYLYPHDADIQVQARRQKSMGKKIDSVPGLKAFVVDNLKDKKSPKAIAILWRQSKPGLKISKETTYCFVYSDEGLAMELPKLLVRAKKKRGFVRKTKKTKIKDAVSIHDRPEVINERKESGHYEGDLIFNKGSMSQNILTLIDRVTRESIMIFNESNHSNVVLGNLRKHIAQNKVLIKSITFDNGSEFAEHTQLNKLKIKTYFCDPGKPYQKGSIENFNGLIRRYLPFELAATQITPQLVQDTMNRANSLPREILGWRSATEYARAIQKNPLLESRVKSPGRRLRPSSHHVFNMKYEGVALDV